MTRTQIPIDRIRDLAEAGMTAASISRQLGLSSSAILSNMKKHGIPVRKRGMQRGGRRIEIPIDEPRMVAMYETGHTCKQIAEILNVSGTKPVEVVRKRLAVLGVQRRIGKASGSLNPQWKGGRSDADRNRYECYKIVVKFLGMLLPKGWIIHHLDENPNNNDLSNLALFPSSRIHLIHHQWLLKNHVEGHTDEAIQQVLKIGGHLLQPLPDRSQSEPDKALLSLLETEAKTLGFRTKWKDALKCQSRR